MTETCGCESRDGHVDPFEDPVLFLRHGERSYDDPEPHYVPGSGIDYGGGYIGSPDAYCLCGHPNYLTCEERDGGGMTSVTVHNVGGYVLTTLEGP